MNVQSKPGPPIAKILLGCGCAGLVIAGIAVALTIGAGVFVSKKVYDENKEAISEGVEAIRKMEEAGKKARDNELKGLDDKSPSAAAVDPDDFAGWVRSPMTTDALQKHATFMESWEGSEAVKSFKESAKSLSESGKETPKGEELSASQKAKILAKGLSFHGDLSVATQEFEALSKSYGGPDVVLKRTFVAVALTTIAADIAKQHKIKDPASAKVAKLMLAAHEPAKKEVDALILAHSARLAAFKGIGQGQDEAAMKKLAEQLQQSEEKHKALTQRLSEAPGTLLVGRVAQESLKSWAALTDGQRRKLLEVGATLPTIPHLMLIPQIQNQKIMGAWLMTAQLSYESAKALKADEPAEQER